MRPINEGVVMHATPRKSASLAMLVSFAAAAGGCSASSGYIVPSAADLYRDRMQYEYEVRSQGQPAGIPAAAVGGLPAWLPEPGPEDESEEGLLPNPNAPG